MGLIENNAIEFSNNIFHTVRVFTLDFMKSELNSALYNYNRYRDKHTFLLVLKEEFDKQLQAHIPKCQYKERGKCGKEKEIEIAQFAVEQEIESIAAFIEDPIYTNADKMSGAEQASMYRVLDEIVEKLRKMELQHSEGVQFLYDEIADLKERLHYDKKTFMQLALGKVAESVALGVVDKSVGSQIYASISQVINNAVNLIDKL